MSDRLQRFNDRPGFTECAVTQMVLNVGNQFRYESKLPG